MLFTLDYGHGLCTPGKRTPDGEREFSFNKIYGEACRLELLNYQNVQVVVVNDVSGTVDTPLSTRTNKANALKSNCHISFHCNANTSKWGSWGGVETHVYKNCSTSSESYKLAQKVQSALVSSSGLRNRGVKLTDLHITRETHMTSILIENGFMDSTTDIKVLRDKAKMQTIGRAIAKAIAEFYGLKLKSNATVSNQQPVTATPIKKVVDSTHIGVATNTDKVNVYSEPNTTSYKRKLSKGSWKVYAIKNKMLCIGNNEWIQGNEMTSLVKYEPIYLKVTQKGSINAYSKPDTKYYKQKLQAGCTYRVYGFSTDKKWIDIGSNTWVPYNTEFVTLV